ncbi:DNA-directed RNA polymerase subunit delta [Alkalihalobacillus sp. AL-G]|uniref:DNA-directed RNA polymerase subunit delta n=1 Tax=Alkalihalobacillus sp. AL-G TaxID=2926399 RepID=UPI00272AF380|nr:DNA-directed RNA polymerase subunit delta [Alkalihalobacillus sp. AL-G]WLD93193.1 DNA-directed RNA polymerase subunit delta [Alkalihalobacillus sp. AL-G]
MLDTYSKQEIKEVSMLDIALTIFRENKKPIPFTELADQVAKIRQMSKEEQKRRIAQFYTDINIDGRFVCIGDNQWGLKSWYPVESSEEELATTIKPKKRKKAKAKIEDDDEDFEDFEEELDDDFDDLDDEAFVDYEDTDDDDDETEEEEVEDK